MQKTTIFHKDAYKNCNTFYEMNEHEAPRSNKDFIIGKALGYELTEIATTYLRSFLDDFEKIDPEHRAKKVAVWDFETTAQHNSFAVSLAIFIYNIETEEIEDTFYELINPLVTITPGAIKVHKITQEDIADCPTFEHFLPTIEKMFDSVDFFVGQNLQFDLAVFERELERLSLPNNFTTKPVFDTMKAGKGIVECYDKNGKIKAPNLEELCDHYGLEVEGEYHNAAVDVQQTLEVFRNLLLE